MLAGVLTWICMVLGSIFLLLLIAPFRISINSKVDDRVGLSYKLMLSWGFGFITVIAVHAEPVMIFLFGFKIWSFSMESMKRKEQTKKRGKSAWVLLKWIKIHYRQVAKIIKIFVHAIFLKGYIVGCIGLPDPADTARIGLLCQQLQISKDRFELTINCVYDRELVRMDAGVQTTLIIGYLGLTALWIFLKKDTRIMFHGLARN